MPLFCIDSAQSFEECEHAARAICQTRHTMTGRRARLDRCVAMPLPVPAKGRRSRSDEFDAQHFAGSQNCHQRPRFTLVKRHDDGDRLLDDQSRRSGCADQLRPERSEQPLSATHARQASASPLGSCVRPAQMNAAGLRELRVIGLLGLNNRDVGAKGQAPYRSAPQLSRAAGCLPWSFGRPASSEWSGASVMAPIPARPAAGQ